MNSASLPKRIGLQMDASTDKKQGLICSYLLDGKGSGEAYTWAQIEDYSPQKNSGLLWININFANLNAQHWIREKSGLSDFVVNALLSKAKARPYSITLDEGTLVILRGVNLKPGAQPDDLVSIRIWIEENRIITSQQSHVLSINDLQSEIEHHHGPRTQGDFLVRICTHITERIADTVDEMGDIIDRFEDTILTQKTINASLANLRRQIINLRRYLAPDREAMSRLETATLNWLSVDNKEELKQASNRIIRHIEDLDAIRDRAAITQEEITNTLMVQSNSRMYLLSVVAVIFLPLSFITGLLGTNVGGIPGNASHWAFPALSIFLFSIALLELWYFKKHKWF